MKRLWEKPKLVVIVRGRPEEAVLGFCKKGMTDPDLAGPSPNKQGCFEAAQGCIPVCSAAQDT